jgi:hypothetical protein
MPLGHPLYVVRISAMEKILPHPRPTITISPPANFTVFCPSRSVIFYTEIDSDNLCYEARASFWLT